MLSSSMFGGRTTASMAGQPAASVIVRGGTGDGGAFGTLNDSKQVCQAMLMPWRPRPVAAASALTSE